MSMIHHKNLVFYNSIPLLSINGKLLTKRHEFLTSSVWHETFSSRRGHRADHAGKNRTSIEASYQKLWPFEVSASNLLIFGQTALNRGLKNPNYCRIVPPGLLICVG